MKPNILACTAFATLATGPALTSAQAADLTIGLSWNSKTQPLEQAWEDYMRQKA